MLEDDDFLKRVHHALFEVVMILVLILSTHMDLYIDSITCELTLNKGNRVSSRVCLTLPAFPPRFH